MASPIECQRLIYDGRQLMDDRTVADSGVLVSSTIRVLSRLRGGTISRSCMGGDIGTYVLPGGEHDSINTTSDSTVLSYLLAILVLLTTP